MLPDRLFYAGAIDGPRWKFYYLARLLGGGKSIQAGEFLIPAGSSNAKVLSILQDGVPIQLEDRFVNPRWVPHYLDTDFARQTPNEVLVASCPISDVEHVVEAVQVDAQVAAWLEIDRAAPCLSVIRRTWSDEHLVSYARLIHPGDRYKLRSTLNRRR